MPAPPIAAFVAATPRPTDFDQFWDETRAELAATPASIGVAPDALRSSDTVTTYSVGYTSLGGVRIFAWLCVPRDRVGCPALVLPLIDNSVYADWAKTFKGKPVPLEESPLPGRTAVSLTARLDRDAWLKNWTAEEDEKNRDHILRAHRNFLRDAVYFLYEYNRVADAASIRASRLISSE